MQNFNYNHQEIAEDLAIEAYVSDPAKCYVLIILNITAGNLKKSSL